MGARIKILNGVQGGTIQKYLGWWGGGIIFGFRWVSEGGSFFLNRSEGRLPTIQSFRIGLYLDI